MDRELDGIYFRVERNGKPENVCFSDMTEEQMDGILQCRDEQYLKNMCKILARTLKHVGDTFDIVSKGDDI